MKINLSGSEWKLMNRLWEQSPRTITQLTAALHSETGWGKHTVITMLSRLEAKGAVRCQQGVRAKQYFPAIERQAAARAETDRAATAAAAISSLTGLNRLAARLVLGSAFSM